jgi:uroporphyrinogen-III decarboxylase
MFTDPDLGKSAKQLKKERWERMHAARTLGVPDRVPVSCPIGNFPAKYCGTLCSDAYYNFNAWYTAVEKTLQDFRPDTFGAGFYRSGKALEIIDPKTMRWPGHGVDPHQGFQSIEINSLQADEFDEYMRNSNDYFLRKHLPRISDQLKGLGKVPPLFQVLHGPSAEQELAMVLTDPEVAKSVAVLQKVGRLMRKDQSKNIKLMKLLNRFGYYSSPMVGAMPPYDLVSHSIRGMTGTMHDMFRQPDKLLELIDFIYQEEIANTPLIPDEHGEINVFMTNTRGSDDFLSKKQFDTFYWPTFKKLVTYLCKHGATPGIFFEGKFDSRVEYLLDLPKGKFIARFDTTDIFRAKEILKGHCCIEGNVPSSLLQVGSKEDVIDYCKKLIDVVGKDGGYVLSPRSSIDEVKPENLQAMIQFTKEYGVYR